MFTKLYNKCLQLAAHKNSNSFLAIVSFFESSFFPIPPDVMIVPMVIAKKNNFIKIFFIATFFSVIGGIFGYILGIYFFDLAITIVEFYGYEDKLISLKETLNNNESFLTWLGILFLAGFTPLPYKLFTIASGIISFNFFVFILISLISRGLRFYIVSYLSFKFGETFSRYMNQYGNKWFTILGIIILIISIIFYILFKYYV